MNNLGWAVLCMFKNGDKMSNFGLFLKFCFFTIVTLLYITVIIGGILTGLYFVIKLAM